MARQTAMDLSSLTVERIEVVPAETLDAADYGHGIPELSASCIGCNCCPCCANPSFYLPEEWDEIQV